MEPRDVGLQTERGRTSKGGSAALPKESPAPAADEVGKRLPPLGSYPEKGGNPLSRTEASASRSFSSLPTPPGGPEALPV